MPGEASTGRKVYTLIIIALVAAVSLMDRSVMTILQEPVRHEFHLNDTQLGLVTGLAFALPHALAALPFGVLADRVERSRLLAGCLAAWSAMMAATGLAVNFWHLLLGRAGVGAGTAAGAPAAISMVADLFTTKRRGTAMAIYYMGTPIGAFVALMGGGYIAEVWGWRNAFVAASVPGFVLALVMVLTTRAPPRRTAQGEAAKAPPIRDVARFIRSQPALLQMMLAMLVAGLVVNAVGNWSPSFFMRYHHLSLRELGLVLGPVSAVTGIIGMLASGLLSDWLARKDVRHALWVIVGSLVLLTPALLLTFAMDEAVPAVAGFALYILISNLWLPAAMTVIQNLAGPSRRGAIAAVILVILGLIGGGLGPLLTGVVSDILRPLAGEDSLRWSMLGFALLAFWAAVHVLLAMRTYREDLARAEAG